MRLSQLDPKWLVKDGRRVGLVFRCPLWDTDTRHQWWQTCFFEKGIKQLTCDDPKCYADPDLWICEHSQLGLVTAAGVDPDKTQGCNVDCAWVYSGPVPLEQATWDQVTVTPSLDGSAGGLWHGFITNGECL